MLLSGLAVYMRLHAALAMTVKMIIFALFTTRLLRYFLRTVLVLYQPDNDECSIAVVFRNKAQYAGNGHSPCQVL